MKKSDRDVEDVVKKYPLKEKPRKRPEQQFDLVLVAISGIVGGSAAYALNTVLPGAGTEQTMLVGFYFFAIGLLSYLGNKVSLHKGTLLAARGDTLAIVGVVAWFIAFGIMVGTLAFTGMSYKIVRNAVLRDAGTAIATVARDVDRTSRAAKQIIPVLISGQSDIDGIVVCERLSGCVSGRPGVGREVTKLNQIAGKYGALFKQFKVADRNRTRYADRLTALSREFERTLNHAHKNWGDKRAALVAIYAKAQRLAGEIEAVMPIAATRGFVSELRSLQVAPARPGRTDVEAELTRHADRLEEVLAKLSSASVALPPFPNPPGIAAGWDKLELTWPLAVFAYLLECAVLYLWFSVYREYVAYQDWLRLNSTRNRDDDDDDDDDDDITLIPPPGPSGTGGGHRQDRATTVVTDLDADPIDGPRGWSGRSRFNANKLDGDDS